MILLVLAYVVLAVLILHTLDRRQKAAQGLREAECLLRLTGFRV